MTKISLVTPCYYNEKNIPDTYEEIVRTVFNACPQFDFEWVCVDDGSKDNTLLELKKIQNKDPRVRIVKLSRNFGEFRAIVAGMEQAKGDAVVVMSADLQDPPSLIPQLVESWQKGNLVTLAVRTSREESAFKTWCANQYYRLVRRWVEPNYPKKGFDFFCIDQKVAKELVAMQEKNSSIYVQLIWLGYNPNTIEYVRQHREKGKSMWTLKKKVELFLDTFVVFSHKPIRFITGAGFIFSIVGLLLALYYAIDWFISQQPPGWTSLSVFILVTSGFQMIMLGVIGEYVWRNLAETRKRPLYVVEKVIEPNQKDPS